MLIAALQRGSTKHIEIVRLCYGCHVLEYYGIALISHLESREAFTKAYIYGHHYAPGLVRLP